MSVSDVIVIGGGIIGASIAWHLAPHSNVTVVAQELGGVATPNSFSWLNADDYPRFYFDFRQRSLKHYHDIAQALPGFPIYSGGGSLNWQLEPESELLAWYQKNKDWGYDVSIVSHTDILEKEPRITEDDVPEWGVLAAEEGSLEASLAAVQMIEDAVASHGAQVLEATVTGFLKQNGRVSGVLTASGQEIHADYVVLAGGLGSVPLLAAENITLPVTGIPGILVNSKPVNERIVTSALLNLPHIHVRQKLDGRILAGAKVNPVPGEDLNATAVAVFAQVQALFKDGQQLELDYYTVGVRPVPDDGLPIIGPSGLEGLSIAVMHGGVANAAIVGQLLSKQTLTGESDPALSNFLLSRFESST